MKKRSYTYTYHGSLQPEDVLMHYHQKLLFVPNSCHVGQILVMKHKDSLITRRHYSIAWYVD